MLNKDSADKILTMSPSDTVNRGFFDLFNATVNEAALMNLPSGTLVVPMYDEKTNPLPGEYVAELHFVVRKVYESATADSDDTVEQEAKSESKG